MPTYATPEPITAAVEIVSGSVHVVATERQDTVVTVSPRDPQRVSDVRVADSARVEFHNGTLTVSAGRRFISLGRGGAVVVDVELPSRSRLEVSSASAGLRAEGMLGDCRVATASGDATVGSVTGKFKADSASGDVCVEALIGEATVSTASGDATFGELTGDLTFRAASGSLSVTQLRGSVSAQTASGDTSVAAAISGEIAVQSGSGDTRVGVEEGTAANLDLRTHSGAVRNALQASDGPADGDETLRVHVKTGSGDISVRRAARDRI
jgi:DUF4097 and DUF4098 domain-containing protein YvlB